MSRGWPLLRRAPARLLRSGSITAMILVSVALLAGLVAAGPLFGSATNAAGLLQRLSTIPDTTAAALRPVVQVTMTNGPIKEFEPQIQALVDHVPYLGGGDITVFGDAWELDPARPTPYWRVDDRRWGGLLYYRTGAVEALQVVAGKRGAPGVWVPEGVAETLGVKPGSTLDVGKTFHYNIPACGAPFNRVLGEVPDDTGTTVKVAGTYRTAQDGRVPAGPYFARIGSTLPTDPGHCPMTAYLLISDRDTIDSALSAVEEQPVWNCVATLTPAGRTPAHLKAAADGAARLRLQAAQPGTEIATLMQEAGKAPVAAGPRAPSSTFAINSGLASIQAQADADAEIARKQGRGIAYAGGVLGLAAVVVALRALSQRRRREAELLLGLGTPNRIVIGAGLVELLLPVLIGAVAGCAAVVLIFAEFGPHPQFDPPAVRSAALAAALVAVIALSANALVTWSQVRQVARSLEGRGESRFGSQWLPTLTGATVLAVIATLTRERNESYQDPMAALLPILVLACGCSLIARGATAIAGAVRQLRRAGAPERAAHGRAGAERLVLRGLRRTGVAVTDLVIVLSIGVGVLAYGLLSADLVEQSVTDKASVLVGAPSTAHIRHSWLLGGGDGPPPGLPADTTVVWRGSGTMQPDQRIYDILVVDPTTLAAAASWGSGDELAEARAALSAFGTPPKKIEREDPNNLPVPALLVGPSDRKAGTTAKLEVAFKAHPIQIRRRLSAFPGVVRPTVVLDARAYFPQLAAADDPTHRIQSGFDLEGDYRAWIWTRQSLPKLLTLMSDHGLPTQETLTLDQTRATPALASSGWAANYQVILGLAAAALAGLAVVAAVDRRVARAAPVDLMLRRFGIRPARLLRLRLVELAVTALGALAVLIGPFVLMVFLLPRLVEPDPALSPSMPVQVTVLPLVFAVLVAVAVIAVAALAAARRSAALKPGEVLRDDT